MQFTRHLIGAAAVLAAALLIVSSEAGEKKAPAKEVTLKGLVACGKCKLEVDAECATVIVVKGADKKDVVYYFDKKGHDKFHADVCGDPKNGSVTGVVSEANKKKLITVKEVKYE